MNTETVPEFEKNPDISEDEESPNIDSKLFNQIIRDPIKHSYSKPTESKGSLDKDFSQNFLSRSPDLKREISSKSQDFLYTPELQKSRRSGGLSRYESNKNLVQAQKNLMLLNAPPTRLISAQYIRVLNKNLERARLRRQSHLRFTEIKSPTKKSSLYFLISNFYLCRKFIQNLLTLSGLRQPKWLTQYHFDLMDDSVFFPHQYKRCLMRQNSNYKADSTWLSQNSRSLFMRRSSKKGSTRGPSNFRLSNPPISDKLQKIKFALKRMKKIVFKKFRFCKALEKHITIYDPTKKLMIIWDFLILTIIAFFFIVIPIECFFPIEKDESDHKILRLKEFGLFFLILDMLKTFNTAYYDKGLLVMNRKEVFSKYVRGSFILDVLSVFPLLWNIYLSPFLTTNYLYFLFFLKQWHFRRILQRFEEVIFLDQNILALLKLIFRMLFICHIFACVWFFVGSTSDSMNTWILHAGITDQLWTSQYLRSFYFIVVTMNTVGFGDITPTNDTEILTIIFIIFIGCGLFAVNLNEIGRILLNISKRSNECSKELNLINQFMSEKDVNFELRMKIRKYLQYIWNEEDLEETEQQFQIINKLSDSLKEELLLEANGPIIRDIKLFNLNFSEETLRQTIGIMKEMKFTPGDLIFHQDEIKDKSIYIIKKGFVEIFYESSEIHLPPKILKKLGPGEIFGEMAFFSNKERTTCARSSAFSTIFAIKQEDFLAIIEKNKKDLERFCQMRESINIYQEYNNLYSKCFSCQDSCHQVNTCPLLHFIPKKEIILMRFLHTSYQDRVFSYCRKTTKPVNALKNLEVIEKKAYEFQEKIFPSHETSSEDIEKERMTETFITKFDSSSGQWGTVVDQIGKESMNFEEGVMSNKFPDLQEIDECSSSRDSLEGNKAKRRVDRHFTRRNAMIRLKSNLTNSGKSLSLINNGKESEGINSFKDVKNYENPPIAKPNHLDLDRVKSFEFYFPENNIERILSRIEYSKLTDILEKTRKHKNTKKYKLFIEDHMNLNERKPNFLIGSSVQQSTFDAERFLEQFEGEAKKISSLAKSNQIQRKFFKKQSYIQKLLQEEEFDEEKFKENYKKQYNQRNRPIKKSFIETFMSVFQKKSKPQIELKLSRIHKSKSIKKSYIENFFMGQS